MVKPWSLHFSPTVSLKIFMVAFLPAEPPWKGWMWISPSLWVWMPSLSWPSGSFGIGSRNLSQT